MKEFTFTKQFTFNEDDIVDIISSAIYDIGYWACIDNDNDVWNNTSNSLPEDRTFEDVFYCILANGDSVRIVDAEGEDGEWELTLDKLLKGIQTTINEGRWDGDMDTIDGLVGDIIFQYALFDEIVYG